MYTVKQWYVGVYTNIYTPLGKLAGGSGGVNSKLLARYISCSR